MGPRIIFVPRRFVWERWGGTETVILETAKKLIALGYGAEVWTSRIFSGIPAEERGGVPVRRFAYFYTYFGLSRENRDLLDGRGGNIISFGLFFSLLFSRGVKLIHLCTMGRLGGMVRTAARIRNIPYVVTIHGGSLNVPPEELAELMRPSEGRFDWGRFLGLIFGARRVLQDAAAIVCVNRTEAELLRARFPGKKVVWMPNGVDINRFESGDGNAFRKKYGIAEERIVLCAARIDPQKNQALLLDAFADLIKEGMPLKLVLAGDATNEAYYAGLMATIRADKALNERVLVLTQIKFGDKDLVDAYAAADVFVLPSRHEPFGVVILEAWSAGKPVIASDVAGVRDIAEDRKQLLFFKSGSPAALKEALLEVLGNGELAGSLSALGRGKAREYGWDSVTQKLVALYEGLA